MLQSRRIRIASLFTIIIALIAVVALPLLGMTSDRPEPRAKDGVLDLRDWSLEQDGVVCLNGEWSFHPKQLLIERTSGAALAANSNWIAKVPGEWTRYGMEGRGYATYQLRVIIQGDIGSLALHLPAIAPSYKVYVDGKKIAQAGTVSAEKASTHAAYLPQTVHFYPVIRRVRSVYSDCKRNLPHRRHMV